MDAEFQARITAKNQTAGVFADVSSGLSRLKRDMLSTAEAVAAGGDRFSELPYEKGSDALKDFGHFALLSVAPILSVDAAIDGVKSALEDFAKISNDAKAAGLDGEFFQELAYAASKSDIAIGDVSTALNTFDKNVGQASDGIGRMYSQLKTLDPALLKQVETAGSQKQAILDVADALAHQSSATRAAAIATAAFGESGTRLLPVLDRGATGLEELGERAKAMGLIVPDDLLNRADEMQSKFETVSQILDLQFKEALVELAPLLVSTTEGIIEIIRGVEGLGTSIRNLPAVKDFQAQTAPLSDRSIDVIDQQIADKQAALDAAVAQHNKAMQAPQIPTPISNALNLLPGGFEATGLGNLALSGDQGGWFGTSVGYQDGIDSLQGEITQLKGARASRSNPSQFDVGAEFGSLDAPQYSSVDALKKALGGSVRVSGSSGGVVDPKAASKIAEVNKQLDLEIANLGKTAEQQQIANELSRAGVTADSAAGKQIAAKVEQLDSEQQALDTLNAVYEDSKDAFLELFDQQRENLANGEDWWESWADAGKSAISDLLGKAEDALLSNAFNDLWFGNGGQSSGSPSGGLGGIISGLLGSVLHFASGTDAAPGGLALVGENGPELMNVPKGAQITPALATKRLLSSSGAAAGAAQVSGATITNNFNITLNSKGADGPDILKQLQRALPAMLADARRRGALA